MTSISSENRRISPKPQDWLAGLLGREGISVDPEARDHLWSNLTSLSSARVEECTLTGLSVLLQSTDVKRALAPFCLGGPFGRLLDAEVEELGSANVLAFENEGRIESAAAPAVLGYLFHRIEARLDGRPTMIVIDKGWLALDDASFGGQLTTFHHGEDHAGFVIIIPILNRLEKLPEISLINADDTDEVAIDVRTINELDFKFLDGVAVVVPQGSGPLCIVVVAVEIETCRGDIIGHIDCAMLIEYLRKRAKKAAGPVKLGIDISVIKMIIMHAAAVHGLDISSEPVVRHKLLMSAVTP